MYIFDKSKCTEGFVGMIHAWAIIAALANMHPVSLIPEINGDRVNIDRVPSALDRDMRSFREQA